MQRNHNYYEHAPNWMAETIQSYVRTRCNLYATARELGLHKNTVQERLVRIEDATGLDMKNGEHIFELWQQLKSLKDVPA